MTHRTYRLRPADPGASRQPRTRTACSIAALLAAAASLHAQAQAPSFDLPPAATPGGAEPFVRPVPPAFTLTESFEIPPLIERPLGLDEGPTVRVERWQLDGVVSRPEHGVLAADVESLLTGHLERQPPAGYTVNQLQAIADEITLLYRNRGLFLAQAFVPAQEVRDGVVSLRVIEGTLGSVSIDGNTLYDTRIMSLPFSNLVGLPIAEDSIEQALLTLQDFPGLTVFGTFREGATLGETELLVQVREEDRATFRPMIDNYGSEYTGEGRVALQFDVNNPFGAADRINGYVLKTFDPANGTYGGVDYSRKIGDEARTTLGFSAARNTFDVTDASIGVDLGLRGIVEQIGARWQRTYAQRRTFRAGGTLATSYKEATTKQPGEDPTDELLDLSYTYDFFAVGGERRGLNLGFVRFAVGDNAGELVSRRGGSGATAEGSYRKLEFSYQRLQRLGDHHALLLKVDGQTSDDLLASLEQYPIGGPANVRAYPISEALVDTGGAVTLEWIIDAPGFADRPLRNTTWGNVFELSFYADYAGGEVNDPFPQQPSKVNLRGYGIGAQFTLAERLSLRIDVAAPDTAIEPSNGRDPQAYLSFGMTF